MSLFSKSGRTISAVAVALFCLGWQLPAAIAQVESYEQATVDENDQLRIVTRDGREIRPTNDGEQVGASYPAISPARNSVGWLALYPNCCTSYPIPLKLVIYSGGRQRTFAGIGLPVWRWRFEAGGRQVAFKQETVHGGYGTHYELRDVATGRLVADFEPMRGGSAPSWVQRLDLQP